MVMALVMAGGKGTRMNSDLEKPIRNVWGKPLIKHVLDALEDAEEVDEIVVATSLHTPQTSQFVKQLGYNVIITPGEGYVEDLSFLVSRDDFFDRVIVTVASDLPLLTGEIVDEVLDFYRKSSKPALSVVVPVKLFRENGLEPSLVLENVVPSGLNILRGKDTEQDEEVLVLDKIELALNINSPEDIISLEKLGDNSRR